MHYKQSYNTASDYKCMVNAVSGFIEQVSSMIKASINQLAQTLVC